MKSRWGSFGLLHFEVPRRTVQPDYERWQAVTIGMTRDEVIELLGRPLRDPYSAPRPRKGDAIYYYGYLQLPLMPYVRTYRFSIGFDDQGRVLAKTDPFDGVFSPDGTPSKPKVFTPPNGTVFKHYPRVVDLRWYPASGQYPIWYEVELGNGLVMNGPFADQVVESELPFPYYVVNHMGDQLGRFRVRGRNELGAGEWSDYQYFDFTP